MSLEFPRLFDGCDIIAGISRKDSTKPNEFSFQMTDSEYLSSTNLAVLTSSIGLSPTQVALSSQVHKADILEVKKAGYYSKFDGLYTEKENLLLGIRIADCAAIIFHDSKRKAVGVVHAGWRGAVAGIQTKMVQHFINRGSSPENILCWISPCISVNHFEVGEEVAVEFPEKFVVRKIGKKPYIDLKGFIKDDLLQGGVIEKNIEISEFCTVGDNETYFSHRAEHGKAGRMMVFVALKS